MYKPVIDDRGIDHIILKEKIYNPIYIQVKTRFNVHKRNRLILTINGSTFKPQHSYYVVGLSFNHERMEMDENLMEPVGYTPNIVEYQNWLKWDWRP